MKRTRRSKERPPERVRRNETPLRRFEMGLGLTFAFAFVTIWALGGRVQEGLEAAMATSLPPVSGSGFGMGFVIAVLIVIHGFLTATETAAEALRPAHVKLVRDRDAKRADRLQYLLDQRGRIVAACSVAAQLVWLAILLCSFLLAPGLLDVLRDRFGWSSNFSNFLLSALLILVPVALVHLVFSELLPKSYALVNPARVGTFLYRLAVTVSVLFSVPAGLVTSLRKYFTERFGARTNEDNANLAEEEIKSLAEEAHETGEIEVGERELLHSVFEFSDTVAREVMTPRVDMDAMPLKSDPTEVANLIQESGHSRIPLYEGTDDQIIGIVHAKDLFGAMLNGKAPNLRSLMRPALFVPENKSLHELLTEMRASRSQMAVVQDEFGGTAGIVTIEDIVEELVGEIVDEYDVEEPEIVEAAGGWLVDGKTHLDDLNEQIGSDIQSEEFDTIGGYVFGLFGRQPKIGEQIEDDGYRFIVAETDGRRIARIKIEPSQTLAGVGSGELEE